MTKGSQYDERQDEEDKVRGSRGTRGNNCHGGNPAKCGLGGINHDGLHLLTNDCFYEQDRVGSY